MTEYLKHKPYQPEDFLRDNRNTISSVFPDFFGDGSVNDNRSEPIDSELQYNALEDRVLGITAHEPAMKLLGRERFAALPQQQRFQLVKDSLELISALNEAKRSLE